MSGFAAVSDILWRERELLDVLLFKLEQERLLLEAGEPQWLPRASREIELVLEQLRLTELTRVLEVDGLAAELGLPAGTTLPDLAAAAPSPWRDLFVAHLQGFTQLKARVCEAAQTNRLALQAARDRAQRRLATLERGKPGAGLAGSEPDESLPVRG